MLAQPLVYHAIHSDKAAGEYQTLCHKPQYRLADLARRRSEESHEGKHDGCDDADQRCHLLITDTLHDKNLLLGSALQSATATWILFGHLSRDGQESLLVGLLDTHALVGVAVCASR